MHVECNVGLYLSYIMFKQLFHLFYRNHHINICILRSFFYISKVKKAIIFVSISCALLVASCHDDPPPAPTVNEAEMVRQLKEYTYFKEGSYWVYQDSATGMLDSMFVYYADDGEGVNSDNEKYYWFNCYVYSTRDSFEYRYWFHSSWTGNSPYRSKLFRIKTRPGNNVGETIIFEYPIVLGNQLYTYGNAFEQNVIRTESRYDSLMIGPLQFYDVVKVSQSMDPSEGSSGNYYLVRNFGIVAHDISNIDLHWKLIRWSFIQ